MSALFDAAKKATSAVGDGLVSVGSAVGDGVRTVGSTVGDGVSAVGSGVSNVAGGVTSSFSTLTVLKAETKAKILGLSPLQVAKVGRIINHLKASTAPQFTDDEIDVYIKTLYVNPSDENVKEAFDCLDKNLNAGTAKGFVPLSTFEAVLPLLGDGLPKEKINELISSVDPQRTGKLNQADFKTLFLGLNPKDESGMFSNLSLSSVPGATTISGGISSFASGIGDNFTTLSVLKTNTKTRLMGASPFALGKIGRIIKAMQSSEFKFNDDEVDDVVKALYVTQADQDFQAVFDMFDSRLSGSGSKQGFLSADKFKLVLPLVGENVPQDKIDDLFKQVDTDGSGNIEFDEFKTLMLEMNPKSGEKKSSMFSWN
eukprot:c8706_g1_i1.p1 GENE.c8706_g1_i1~~c8706_g1_i1.p1  ORF type:complete len:402 (+),score=131.87 c8706_g1_i1:95-1207(+)